MAKKKAKRPVKNSRLKSGKAAPKKVTRTIAAKKKAAKKISPAKKASPKKAVKKTAKKATVKVEQPFTSINPYLTFTGNCEEAFNFYKSVFGGKFTYVGRFKEMPPEEGQPPLPPELAEKIMHISLPISKETTLMGSDAAEGFGPPIIVGNNFSVSINAPSEKEADRLYTALSSGGIAAMPMSKTFWGSYFGMLTDKFGINWMVSAG